MSPKIRFAETQPSLLLITKDRQSTKHYAS